MPESIEVIFNSPNELPANFREVDEAEFVLNAMRRVYHPQRIEYRQVEIEDKPVNEMVGRSQRRGLSLYWYHNGKGDCILLDYFSKSARFFLFAECEHKMKHTAKLGRCFNRYTCSECGYVEDVDSGD